MSQQQVILVTGVSSGIGRATAQMLSESGHRVFGTVRSRSTAVPNGVEPVTLDVRDKSSIDAAIASILGRTGRIDALVNNAGGTIVGAIEETETQQVQDLFDVNFFGSVRVTRAVLPAMRAQRSGRIVFLSSVVGFLPAPFMGFYAASKHAIEGYAESLDHEVRGFGVRAILVEPGFMKTSIDRNAANASQSLPEYRAARERARALINGRVDQGDDPALVARAVVKALSAPRPKLRYQVGRGAALLATLRDLLPAGLFDRSFRKEFGLDS
jgi:NAD(P)-dependent dehydrogenase (short-subunit alcohol dehydrogenase family)